ncbi:hypothetical protein OUZ56_005083 [Daphnia magna]|uniref:Uncharacterized protein n=1 Tax=Daphnia magna TaxID=35525 RepID=A0ABQ9YRS4_9CRUS|nr:hypothetical protein OUZ56_005083 [Daphnia magna]
MGGVAKVYAPHGCTLSGLQLLPPNEQWRFFLHSEHESNLPRKSKQKMPQRICLRINRFHGREIPFRSASKAFSIDSKSMIALGSWCSPSVGGECLMRSTRDRAKFGRRKREDYTCNLTRPLPQTFAYFPRRKETSRKES